MRMRMKATHYFLLMIGILLGALLIDMPIISIAAIIFAICFMTRGIEASHRETGN